MTDHNCEHCPICDKKDAIIAELLDKLHDSFQGYLLDLLDSKDNELNKKQSEINELKADNHMLRKMQPVIMTTDAAMSIANAIELSIAQSEIAELKVKRDEAVVHGAWRGYTKSAYMGTDEYGDPKWADRKFYSCNKCYKRTAIKSKFCPNCGARMDLEE